MTATSLNQVLNRPIGNHGYESGKAIGVASKRSETNSLEDLMAWYQGAMAYVNAVVSGQEAAPQSAQWTELLNQIEWCNQQMRGAGWDPSQSATGALSPDAAQADDPFGGIPGTMGNVVYNDAKTRVGFTGDGVRDIYGNDVTIDVAPMSARVSAEISSDTRWTPPEDVLKIVVTDPATGTEAVYFVHDYQDAHIKINTPTGQIGSDSTGGLIEVGTFTAASSTASGADDSSNVAGEPQPDGSLLYDIPSGQTVEFSPTGNGESGSNQTHLVYGDANITVRNSDHVDVEPNVRYDEARQADETDGYKITVTHRDGSQDTFIVYQGFNIGLNAPESAVTWHAWQDSGGHIYTNEAEYSADAFPGISLNGDSQSADSAYATGPLNSTDAGIADAEPSRIEGNIAYYDNPADEQVAIHTFFGDAVDEHHIVASGPVKIYVASNSDKVLIKKSGDGYTVEVYRNGITDPSDPDFKKETYLIEGNPSSIDIQAIPANVRTITEGAPHWTPAGGDPDGYESGSAYESGSISKVSVAGEGPSWPGSDVLENLPTGGSSSNEAATLIHKINDAIRGGNWYAVQQYISALPPEAANNVIRKVITAIYETAGTDDKFYALMSRIPADVRDAMQQAVSANGAELNEIQDGDEFDSATTAEMIDASADW